MRWLPLLLLLSLVGCAHVDPMPGFARAGVAYSHSLHRALDAAERSAVDASSWRLLADDQLSNLDLAALEEANARDEARMEQLDRLRAHSGLLASYLNAIASLIDTDLPARVIRHIDAIWKSTANLSQALIGSPILPPANLATKPLEELIDRAMHARVRAHLAERATEIRDELVLQEAVLTALSRGVVHERQLAKSAALQHTVVLPLLAEAPVPDPEQWVAQRRVWLLADDEPKPLRDARRAAHALRVAFEDLVEGRLDAAAADRLETELRNPALLSGVEVPE